MIQASDFRQMIAKGRRTAKPPGEMNKIEQEYARHLATLQAGGQIAWFAFGVLKLKLADKCWYTPDFVVMMPDGTLELRETKGFMEDDAAVKLRMVAGAFWMFRLVLVTKSKTGWNNAEYTKPPG